jgi:hypothetical protein
MRKQINKIKLREVTGQPCSVHIQLHKKQVNHIQSVWSRKQTPSRRRNADIDRMYKIKMYKQDIPAGPATFGWVVTSETS